MFKKLESTETQGRHRRDKSRFVQVIVLEPGEVETNKKLFVDGAARGADRRTLRSDTQTSNFS